MTTETSEAAAVRGALESDLDNSGAARGRGAGLAPYVAMIAFRKDAHRDVIFAALMEMAAALAVA